MCNLQKILSGILPRTLIKTEEGGVAWDVGERTEKSRAPLHNGTAIGEDRRTRENNQRCMLRYQISNLRSEKASSVTVNVKCQRLESLTIACTPARHRVKCASVLSWRPWVSGEIRRGFRGKRFPLVGMPPYESAVSSKLSLF